MTQTLVASTATGNDFRSLMTEALSSLHLGGGKRGEWTVVGTVGKKRHTPGEVIKWKAEVEWHADVVSIVWNYGWTYRELIVRVEPRPTGVHLVADLGVFPSAHQSLATYVRDEVLHSSSALVVHQTGTAFGVTVHRVVELADVPYEERVRCLAFTLRAFEREASLGQLVLAGGAVDLLIEINHVDHHQPARLVA